MRAGRGGRASGEPVTARAPPPPYLPSGAIRHPAAGTSTKIFSIRILGYTIGMDSKFIAIGVGLLVQAGGIVWWASNLQGEVRHNNYQIQMMSKDVDKHAIFVRDWPSGKYGSGALPSDVKQDLKIGVLEKQVDKIMSKLYNGVGSD